MVATERSGLVTKGSYEERNSHKPVNAGLIVVNILLFIVMVGFNGLAGSGAGIPSVFKSTTGNLSAKYEIYFTPAGSTFSIWGIIYFWVAASLLVLIITVCLSNSRGPIYVSPVFATVPLLLVMAVNFLLNLSWIFLWDREFQVVAAVILILIAITNVLVVGLMARNLGTRTEYTMGQDMFVWGIVYRVIMNGFALYTTWTVIASLINLTTALTYVGGTDMTKTCLATLSLLVVFHCVWFGLENFLLDKYVRYLLTPYVVVIWASAGILKKKWGDSTVPAEIQNYVLAILIIASITLAVRLVIVAYRTFRTFKSSKVDQAF